MLGNRSHTTQFFGDRGKVRIANFMQQSENLLKSNSIKLCRFADGSFK